MKAIILAGGFGTRLKDVTSNTPKSMVDMNGRPFLEVLLERLEKQGFEEFTLSVHHLKEKIIEHFKDKYNVRFAVESEPLGTGGAIVNAMKQSGYTGNVAVMNGDSLLKINYKDFFVKHGNRNVSLALREVADTERYGRVEVDGEKITDFREKGVKGKGLINTGYYIMNCDWMLQQKLPQRFSVELDLFKPKRKDINAGYFAVNDYFIDIGVPEDYEKAVNDLKNNVFSCI